MEFKISCGKTVSITKSEPSDAVGIIALISSADAETPFLAREPGEFRATVEKEKSIIHDVSNSQDTAWFTVKCDEKIIGQCSVSPIRRLARYKHRCEVAFVIQKAYCGLGIGGRMMQTCLDWCKKNNFSQVELSVVANNFRAIAMYMGFGFRVVGTMPNALKYADGSFADEYLMVKEL